MVDNTTTINHKVNEFIRKNPSATLDVQSSQKLLENLKTHIVGSDKLEKVNSIVILSKLVEILPQSEELSLVLDEKFYQCLFSIVSPNLQAATFDCILIFSIALLKGSISTNTIPVLNAICKNIQIVDVITAKLISGNTFSTISFSIQFISRLLSSAVEKKFGELIVFMKTIRDSTFFMSITALTEDSSLFGKFGKDIQDLTRSIINCKRCLNTENYHTKSKNYHLYVHELLELYAKNLNPSVSQSTRFDYVTAGLSSDPKRYILENYSITNLIDIISFLHDPNLTFKKEYSEQLIFADESSCFPLSIAAMAVSDFLFDDVLLTKNYINLKNRLYSVDSLFYVGMLQMLRIWKTSNAEAKDVPIIIKSIHTAYTHADTALGSGSSMGEVLGALNKFSYADLRKIQLREIRERHSAAWMNTSFDKFLQSEVMNFIKEQRLLNLSKGSWVYAENPVRIQQQQQAQNNTGSRKPQMYFLILSPNNLAIIYKEFKSKSKQTPNIDKTGHVLDINSIANFEATPVDNGKQVPENSRLITIKSKSSYEKITLIGKNKKTLLSFYTDTKEASYIWLDGLKLLANSKFEELSEDTQNQIKVLVDVRKNAQLISLDDTNSGTGAIAKDFTTENRSNSSIVEDHHHMKNADLYDFDLLKRISGECYYN
ncbi:hypothetical protein PACTADRAFT_47465 [Pachysolen tannophilus NRRL Y-2460]|uniref:PH domain-containing protein n=1 Tax=Pachysolen tannophilus NRRL Y-2460 TaxID=669874 RepID=A0A1E4U0P4_PACTA|nr:hypothetical protein PACTADRAFT_47465 [Pachysolen tannophilus NRRL Y-2460]